MATRKKTDDPVDSLRPTSRRVLERAPADGRYEIPYTVGRVFFLRGWGAHLGKNYTSAGKGIPTSLFQLNEAGLQAAETARQRSRAELDQTVYAAVHEATMEGMSALLEDYSLDGLIRSAEDTLSRVDQAGASPAGARGYLDALVQYRDEQAQATA